MRVLTVLEILQARDHVTGAELAERLEVDLRTVQRYIARLQDLSIPVEGARGCAGSYRLKPGFRLPPLMFTNEEAFALSLGLKALRNLGLAAFAPASEGAAAKLERVLPSDLRESVAGLEQVVAVEPGPWIVPTPAASLLAVATAIRTRREIQFPYESHDKQTSHRAMRPYAVAHLDGRWYAVGHCLLRNDLRTFRVDRMASVTITAIPFERPASFDGAAYLNRAMPFVQSRHRIEVWLDMPLDGARAYFGPNRVVLEPEGKGTVLRCGRDQLDAFAAMLLAPGVAVEVRQPDELRDAFRRVAARAEAAAKRNCEVGPVGFEPTTKGL